MNQDQTSPNKSNRRRLPAIAAVGLIAATGAVSLASKMNGDSSKDHPAATVEANGEPQNRYHVDPAALAVLTPEQRQAEYVTLVAGASRNGGNDGTISGLAYDYANLYELDRNEVDQIQESLLEQSPTGVALPVGAEFVLPRLGDQDPNENQMDQVR